MMLDVGKEILFYIYINEVIFFIELFYFLKLFYFYSKLNTFSQLFKKKILPRSNEHIFSFSFQLLNFDTLMLAEHKKNIWTRKNLIFHSSERFACSIQFDDIVDQNLQIFIFFVDESSDEKYEVKFEWFFFWKLKNRKSFMFIVLLLNQAKRLLSIVENSFSFLSC